MTKPEDEKISTVAAVEEQKRKCIVIESITDKQYSKAKGPGYGKFLKKSLTPDQKKEIIKLSQEGWICVDPRYKHWLPGTFRGRARSGGRKKGTRNKYVDVADILGDIGCNPILGLARLAMNKKNDPALRAKCYSELAQYTHPKVKAVDRETGHTGDNHTLTVKLVGADPEQLEEGSVEEAEVLPYEEDGVTNEGKVDGYPDGMTKEDWNKVEELN